MNRDPVVVFWEMTLACALSCRHCRAEAVPQRSPNEFSTEESFRVMDQLASFDTQPIVVLSGATRLCSAICSISPATGYRLE